MSSASTRASVRPVVLALAPPAPGLSRGSATPCLELLGGSRLIERLLGTLEDLELPVPLLVAAHESAAELREVLGARVPVHAVNGDRRSALRAVLAATVEDRLLLHDAERALTPSSVVSAVLSALEEGIDAVVPVVGVTDSVKEVHPEGLRNIDRSSLVALQSPRLLRREVLERCVGAPPSAAAPGPERPERFDEILAAVEAGARVTTVHGSHSGFAVLDRLSLWQAQISLGLARDTSHRHGLARRA